MYERLMDMVESNLRDALAMVSDPGALSGPEDAADYIRATSDALRNIAERIATLAD